MKDGDKNLEMDIKTSILEISQVLQCKKIKYHSGQIDTLQTCSLEYRDAKTIYWPLWVYLTNPEGN